MSSIFYEQVFNELSANFCYRNIDEACAGMNRFCDVLRFVSNAGMKYFYISHNFSNYELCEGYSIHKWHIDKSVDKTIKQYLLTKVTKNSYIETYLEKEYRNINLLKECSYEGKECLGLEFAYFKNTNVLSLDGDSRFSDNSILMIERECLEDSISEISVKIPSVCNYQQAYNRLYTSIGNGKELVSVLHLIFPYLLFADNAKNQLLELHGNERYFRDILDHFKALNTGVMQYRSGVFSPVPSLDFSKESESTMNNMNFREKRTFRCADGIERVFKYHSKIRFDNQRIYFEPDLSNHIVHIGYVGEHLPTTQFPH